MAQIQPASSRSAVPERRFYEHNGAMLAAEKLENRGDNERVEVGYVWRCLRQNFAPLKSRDLE